MNTIMNQHLSSADQKIVSTIKTVKTFNKAAHEKNCRFRLENGFCTRSNRQCPFTLKFAL